jgi:hypothetical protein
MTEILLHDGRTMTTAQMADEIDRLTRCVLEVPDPESRIVRYLPWTDGYAIGFRLERDDGKVDHVYLNPSNNDDGSDDPNVFVYSGPAGTPAIDGSLTHIVQDFPS